MKAVRLVSQNKGYSLNWYTSEFSLKMHPLKEAYFEDGVRFSVDVPYAYEAEVIVTFEVFYKYLVRVCMIYLEMHPEDSREVPGLLEMIRINLAINEV